MGTALAKPVLPMFEKRERESTMIEVSCCLKIAAVRYNAKGRCTSA
jgi:hypothetical protein